MGNISKAVTFFIFSTLVSFVSSCDEESNPQDIIGRWRDTADFHGWYDKFEIENDLEGEGQFWIYYEDASNNVVFEDYDLEADGDGDTWVIEATAEKGELYDFEMECERDGENLVCSCSGGFCADAEWTFEPN